MTIKWFKSLLTWVILSLSHPQVANQQQICFAQRGEFGWKRQLLGLTKTKDSNMPRAGFELSPSNAKKNKCFVITLLCKMIQARIAQLVAYRLGTGEVLGSNPGKGENFSVKISNWIVRITNIYFLYVFGALAYGRFAIKPNTKKHRSTTTMKEYP